MQKTISPQDQTFWYLDRPNKIPRLENNLETDVVIIGAGMAGLTAAQAFIQKNKRVVVLEAFFCGAGASGKSSGFITPNSELSLSKFIELYGQEGGSVIWKVIESGVEHIRTTIHRFNIDCDYTAEDSLLVANSQRAIKELQEEDKNLIMLFKKSHFIEKDNLSTLIGSTHYHGGVLYKNTFGISAYKYCQALKNVLTAQGVQIFEETPVLQFGNHLAHTLNGTVKAQHIIVCADRFTPHFNKLNKEIYHAQNFLLISQPLHKEEIRYIFPDKRLMVWDTELIYNYFRMSGNRLLLGGGSLLNLYNRSEQHNNRRIFLKLSHYFKRQFPHLDIQFEQFWPGMIGISKDIAPLMGYDKHDSSVYYIAAAAGLPIAAALANYCADAIVDKRDDLKDYFSPYRKYAVPTWAQSILGTKLSFALSNFLSVGSQ